MCQSNYIPYPWFVKARRSGLFAMSCHFSPIDAQIRSAPIMGMDEISMTYWTKSA